MQHLYIKAKILKVMLIINSPLFHISFDLIYDQYPTNLLRN